MKPWEIVDRARAPDGAELVLARRGDEWVVRAAGRVLMSSRAHGSEEALARLETRDTIGGPPFDAILLADGGDRLRSIASLLAFFDVEPATTRFLGTMR